MKAWQRKIREQREAESLDSDLFGAWWKSETYSLDHCVVEQINSKDAASIILKYEWLGTMPPFAWRCFGLRHKDSLLAASVFVALKNGNVPYTLFHHRSVALVRGASVHWAPTNAASKLTQGALRLIEVSSPEMDFAVAFVDSEAGEIGTIYQACGWHFLGWTTARRWEAPNGTTFNPSHHRNLAWNRHGRGAGRKVTPQDVKAMQAQLIAAGWRIVVAGKRGRYAAVLKSNRRDARPLVKLLEKHSKPYPKRESSEANAATNAEARFDPAIPLQTMIEE